MITVPRLSVILPVYNGLPYLEEAVRSVLTQSFDDFELIIINDGSTDGSAAAIRAFDDPRIRFYEQPNRGLPATLNRAIALSTGEYVARQDQDDICFPQRFQKQVEFLDAHPDVGMVGTAAEIWVGAARTKRGLAHATDDAAIKFNMLFSNNFVHSSMMIRRAVFAELGGYAEDKMRQPPEDYELWSRVMRRHKVANLPEVLMAYREVPSSMSRAGINPFLPNLLTISAENIAWASGYAVDSPEVIALARLSQGMHEEIPRGITFSRLREVIEAAARTIGRESGVPPQQLGPACRERLRRLRQQYWNFRSGGLLAKVAGGRVGRVLKRLAVATGGAL